MTEAELIMDAARGWQRGRVALSQPSSNHDAISYAMRIPFGKEVINEVSSTFDRSNTLPYVTELLGGMSPEGRQRFYGGLASVFMATAGTYFRDMAASPKSSLDIQAYIYPVGNDLNGTPLPKIETNLYLKKADEMGILTGQFRQTQAENLRDMLDKDKSLAGLYTPNRPLSRQFAGTDVNHFVSDYVSRFSSYNLIEHLLSKGRLFEQCLVILSSLDEVVPKVANKKPKTLQELKAEYEASPEKFF